MHLLKRLFFIAILLVGYSVSMPLLSQDHNHDHSGHGHHGHDHDAHDHSGHDHSGHDHSGHDHSDHASGVDHGHNSDPCSHDPHANHGYDPTGTAIHHISDGNVFTILDAVHIPLPTILKHKTRGWDVFMSNKFGAGHHGDGHYAYKGYVLHHGNVHIVKEADFPVTEDKIEIGHFAHGTEMVDGKEKDITRFCYNNKAYTALPRTTLDGGLLGGGVTPFMDFSITKHVASMMIIALLLFFLFRSVAKSYQKREGQAPTGLQGLIETFIVFIRDEVAIPFIGEHKYNKYLPFLLSVFFFILGLNLWGQVPFFGSANVTGTISVTMVLAIIVFIIVNFSGNKHYWQHVFWMPGVPVLVKPLLAVVETMGLFIKPLTLMLRLAGNITAGHIAILSFIGLIFIFGNAGQNMMGGSIGVAMSVPLTLFMMAIELIVAFIQAYVFTLLAASYIGAATEEEHH